jgi:acetyl-CoA carboxylase beta subunit
MPEPKAVIRCPYCVEGSHFKLMSSIADGDWHKCQRCGHVVFQNDPSYQCVCPNCVDLNR